jgi:hypothetical protein
VDKSAVKEIVEREIGKYLSMFGIPHWRIKISYEPDAETQEAGRCTRQYDYNQAWILLNPELLEDEARVLEILRHELYHIVLSPYDLYATAVEDTLGEDHKAAPALERVWRHAMEKTVINLGRMYVGLTESETARGSHPTPVVPAKTVSRSRKQRR